MIFNNLVTFLKEKNEKRTKLSFITVRMSPYRFANRRHIRNRGLINNPF
ncbi:hypothetical protein BXY75_2113 [Ulvibacter antarcticus]|uniref:Uncharacterized protein n=1 Tax=Ulvibacter antarcticus TaxID=442714 RepID=A0A3L9YDF6_9FLAO|nr:hypothetical protein BXY75_2113 [Ulvibacter antarcticus]